MKKFLEFAIEKATLNHLFLLFIFILSIFAYKSVPKEIFPPATLDKILISGGYAGASAQTLDKMVVKNLEDELKNVQNLYDIDAIIKNGSFTIVSDIKEGANNLLVLNDVKDKIAKIRKDLPPDMDEPIATILTKSFPLVLIAIATDANEHKLLDVADRLKSDLTSLKNLSEVDIRGWREDELQIAIDPQKINALGLGLLQVSDLVAQLSTIFPIGSIKQRGNHFFLTTQNGKKEKRALENTILVIGKKRVRLGDIANVSFTLSEPVTLSHFNGKPNVSINVTKTKNGNAIELVKKIKKLLLTYKNRYPGFEFKIYTDTSIWIRNRLNTVTSNLIFGLILVFTALLLTVDWRIALVVGMGIPVSFMIGLISLEMLGYSLNMLSLFGALIALGMLVDEAIVVAENIYRHLEMGEDAKTAAIQGSLEMFPAVLTATATTIFAFLPLLIISGEMGIFIRILPVIISILLLSSLFEAFYFLPLHAKEILKVGKKKKPSRLWQFLGDLYENVLRFLLERKRVSTLLLVGSILFGTFILLKETKFQLFPAFDTTQIYISGSVNVNSDVEDTQKIVSKLEQAILHSVKKDEVSSVTAIFGMKLDAKNNAQTGSNLFHIFVNLHELKPQNFVDRYITPLFSIEYDSSDMVRDRSARAIAEDIKRIVETFRHPPFEEINVIVPQAGIVKSDIEVSLEYEDPKQVLKAIHMLENGLKGIKGVYNITDDAKEGEKELKLILNDFAERLGITEGYLASYLKSLYLDAEIAKMFKNSKLIYVKLKSIAKDSVESFKNLVIQTPNGQKVLLKDIASFWTQRHFYNIIKENGKKIRTVYASLNKKVITTAEVYDKLDPLLRKIEKLGVKVKIKGEQKENKKLIREITRAFVIAVFLIFGALVWMFNSFVYSLIVLSVIPLSLFGVLVGNKIMGINLTMPGMLGLVGLAGVVVNDGLIMLDFIRSCNDIECVIQRAKLRLRPIMLTSITTILGLSTLMFFASGQSLILQPMAITLGFGIGWATCINLLLVPLLYSVVKKVQRKV
ncbi:efflux RND transporter permease subunit [Nitratiruptor sp. SB155-2]|uniref:efflux RND transporter permease subunit n=1 Tax=Nitratiruptor sp. (strain SB155-2) TaxID=387092 RepID=UPI0001587308|nr:efflux RND transporter permease subunit [Nitratiruptor sp. SB155-2]BAF70137.1 cation:multidrug efflux pump [Nitratiruptor sp. SB155-2]